MSIISQVFASVSLGKVNIKMPFYVADIGEDCILGENFFSEAGVIDEIFDKVFGSSEERKQEGKICSRIKNSLSELPNFFIFRYFTRKNFH